MAIWLSNLTYVLIIAIIVLTLLVAWPVIGPRLHEMIGGVSAPVQLAPASLPAPTLRPQAPSAPRTGTEGSGAAPIDGIAQNSATATAMYQATAQAALVQSAPPPNVNTTNDSAPVVREQIATDRQPAGENVPTAEPVQEGESGGIFGSKPVIVAPQMTHECRHGQVWVEEKGCRNP
jgi:hypothetical protein